MTRFWLILAMLALAASIWPVERWSMQDHVSLRTTTIIAAGYITIGAALTIAAVLLP